jgi:hypothetical protein
MNTDKQVFQPSPLAIQNVSCSCPSILEAAIQNRIEELRALNHRFQDNGIEMIEKNARMAVRNMGLMTSSVTVSSRNYIYLRICNTSIPNEFIHLAEPIEIILNPSPLKLFDTGKDGQTHQHALPKVPEPLPPIRSRHTRVRSKWRESLHLEPQLVAKLDSLFDPLPHPEPCNSLRK